MFSPRHSGSRGTLTRIQRDETRAISPSTAAGSGTCSSTSIAVAASNSPSLNGQAVAAAGVEVEVRALAALPLLAQLRVVEVDPDHAPRDVLGPLLGQHALAAPDVEDGRRRAPGRAARTCRARSRPSAASRQGWSSRTCRRCCRSGMRSGSDAGEAALLTSVVSERNGLVFLASGGLSAADRGRGQLVARRLPALGGLVVRGLDAQLQLDAARALQRALDQHAVRGQQIADDAQRRKLHGHHEQHRAEHDRLDVARRRRPG